MKAFFYSSFCLRSTFEQSSSLAVPSQAPWSLSRPSCPLRGCWGPPGQGNTTGHWHGPSLRSRARLLRHLFTPDTTPRPPGFGSLELKGSPVNVPFPNILSIRQAPMATPQPGQPEKGPGKAGSHSTPALLFTRPSEGPQLLAAPPSHMRSLLSLIPSPSDTHTHCLRPLPPTPPDHVGSLQVEHEALGRNGLDGRRSKESPALPQLTA